MPLWIAIVLLGIIEGITEFIPVSSTGHLLLAEHWLPKQTDLFNIVIQTGAVLAVIPLFWTRIQQLACRWREPETRDFILKISVAFGITAVGGYLLEKKGWTLKADPTPIAAALVTGGVLFLIVERWLRGRNFCSEVTWLVAILVGLGQLLAAIFPGASRSGTTILIALILGLARPAATEFSFLVGIPTMVAAGGWKIFKALHHPAPGALPENWAMVFLGTAVAAVVSFVAVKWLLRFVQAHTFNGFGAYRIVAGVLILILLR